MRQFTKDEAIVFCNSKAWKDMDPIALAKFQLFQDLLCIPFGVFHEAMEKALGRPVWTHEFAYRDQLKAELMGDSSPPTMEDIINLIPADKRLIVTV
jgi:hypothetical protein